MRDLVPQELRLIFAALCAALGLYIAYRRGKLQRTIILGTLLVLIPVLFIYFRQ